MGLKLEDTEVEDDIIITAKKKKIGFLSRFKIFMKDKNIEKQYNNDNKKEPRDNRKINEFLGAIEEQLGSIDEQNKVLLLYIEAIKENNESLHRQVSALSENNEILKSEILSAKKREKISKIIAIISSALAIGYSLYRFAILIIDKL